MTIVTEEPVWSKSQVATLRECSRKWALSYRSAGDDPTQVNPLTRLKKLKNRHLWIGSLIHETIGDVVKIVRQKGDVLDIETLLNQTKEKMRTFFLLSKTDATTADRLFEHEFNTPVAPQVWKEMWNKVETSLRWFMASKWLNRLKEMGPETWKIVDEVVSFDIGGIKTYVKIDCALESDGKFYLIDWKSSAPRAEDDAALLVAALYAHEVWGADPEMIVAMSVSLLDGQSKTVEVTEDNLMETYLKIQEESGLLQENSAVLGTDPMTAPMTTSLQTCRRCNYQRICYPTGDIDAV
jgi:PD-(D/E)XK nuclease superfamily